SSKRFNITSPRCPLQLGDGVQSDQVRLHRVGESARCTIGRESVYAPPPSLPATTSEPGGTFSSARGVKFSTAGNPRNSTASQSQRRHWFHTSFRPGSGREFHTQTQRPSGHEPLGRIDFIWFKWSQ